MSPKKDIGMLFKQKLAGAAKEPNAALWDKIEVSLDKRDRKKRGFILFWLGTGTAVAITLLLLFLWTTSEETSSDSLENPTNQSSETSSSSSEVFEVFSDKNNTTTKADALPGNNSETNENDGSNLRGSEEKNNLTPIKSKSNAIKNQKNKDPFFDDSVTVRTTYQYYNGATKELIETTDKRVIDSLLKYTKINKDSLRVVETKIANPNKKDSLSPQQ